MQSRYFLTMFVFGAAVLARPGFAADTLKVDEARVVATVPGQTVAAAYLTLESSKDARVVSAESDVAESGGASRVVTLRLPVVDRLGNGGRHD